MKRSATHPTPKRPFNLLLNEATVRQARKFTDNLSSTVDSLLTDYVAKQEQAALAKQRLGDEVAEAWNRFHAAHGSFADEHSTL